MEGQRVGKGNTTLLYLSCADSAFILISQQINVISQCLFVLYGDGANISERQWASASRALN